MAYCKNQQAEKTQQQKCIINLGGFTFTIIAYFVVGFIPVIQRKKRLDDPGHPEEGYQSGNKQEHLPWADLSTGKMAFGKYYTDNKEDSKPHQLEKLEPWNIVNQFYFSQSW